VIVAALEEAELAGSIAGIASVGRVEVDVGGSSEIRATGESERRRKDEQ